MGRLRGWQVDRHRRLGVTRGRRFHRSAVRGHAIALRHRSHHRPAADDHRAARPRYIGRTRRPARAGLAISAQGERSRRAACSPNNDDQPRRGVRLPFPRPGACERYAPRAPHARDGRRPRAEVGTSASWQRSCLGAPVRVSARCWVGRRGAAGSTRERGPGAPSQSMETGSPREACRASVGRRCQSDSSRARP